MLSPDLAQVRARHPHSHRQNGDMLAQAESPRSRTRFTTEELGRTEKRMRAHERPLTLE